jgi:hypothetical protein
VKALVDAVKSFADAKVFWELKFQLLCIAPVAAALLFIEGVAGAIAAWLILTGALITLWGGVIPSGIEVRKFRQGENCNVDAVTEHRWYARIFVALVLNGVIGTEMAVRKLGSWGELWFVVSHITLAILSLAVMISVLAYGCKESKQFGLPRRHYKMAYLLTVCYVATFLTGSYMFNEKLGPLRSVERIAKLK